MKKFWINTVTIFIIMVSSVITCFVHDTRPTQYSSFQIVSNSGDSGDIISSGPKKNFC